MSEQRATGELQTVRELISLYLQHSRLNSVHSPQALLEREYAFDLFTSAHDSQGRQLGDLAVSECKAFHLTDFIASHPSWRSSATRRSKAGMLRAAFQWALDEERINRNPFRKVQYAEGAPRPPMPDDALEEVLLIGNKRFERAVRFLRLTGCRLSELCQLTWQDVDLDGGQVVVQQHKTKNRTGKSKVLVIVPEAVALLQEIRRAQRGDSKHVFLNTRNTPWNRRTLGQHLHRLKQTHGINTSASLHGLRHAFATQAIANGASLKLVSQALGHSSVAVTEKYYVQLAGEPEAVRQAAMLATSKKPQSVESAQRMKTVG